MSTNEIITVDATSVACDGGGGPLGHPRVFLSLERAGAVDCPYCGRRFVLDHAAAEQAAAHRPVADHNLPPAPHPPSDGSS